VGPLQHAPAVDKPEKLHKFDNPSQCTLHPERVYERYFFQHFAGAKRVKVSREIHLSKFREVARCCGWAGTLRCRALHVVFNSVGGDNWHKSPIREGYFLFAKE
jgi:hypothetical protein